jgi:NAD(P)-dependent dehydrogenase (short-subunit alcohol dehydrogenase family)
VIADVNDDAGTALAQVTGATYVHADVTNTDDVLAAISAATALAPLWNVVNCAGILAAQRTVSREATFETAHDLETFRRVVEVNLVGTFNVCRLTATAMAANAPDADGARGAIVNTSSVAAQDGQIGQVAYASSKGGIMGLTLPLARDLSAIGVRVNCVLPGLIDTPIYGEGEASDALKVRLGESALFPKRLAQSAEFASMVLELLRNSYMNASTVRLDAGIRMPPK